MSAADGRSLVIRDGVAIGLAVVRPPLLPLGRRGHPAHARPLHPDPVLVEDHHYGRIAGSRRPGGGRRPTEHLRVPGLDRGPFALGRQSMASHALARAAYKAGIPMWKGAMVDQVAPRRAALARTRRGSSCSGRLTTCLALVLACAVFVVMRAQPQRGRCGPVRSRNGPHGALRGARCTRRCPLRDRGRGHRAADPLPRRHREGRAAVEEATRTTSKRKTKTESQRASHEDVGTRRSSNASRITVGWSAPCWWACCRSARRHGVEPPPRARLPAGGGPGGLDGGPPQVAHPRAGQRGGLRHAGLRHIR